jgi:hypothetical protein
LFLKLLPQTVRLSYSFKIAVKLVPTISTLGFVFCALVISFGARAWAEQDQESARWLTVCAGVLPIILAAPHGGRAAVPGIVVRRGVGVAQFMTERDSNTAELTELIAVKVTARHPAISRGCGFREKIH